MSFLDISLYCLIELIDQFWRISSLVVRDFPLTSAMMLLFTQLSEMFFTKIVCQPDPNPLRAFTPSSLLHRLSWRFVMLTERWATI